MLINHEYKFISISVPKTGSTSIHHGLQKAANSIFNTKIEAPSIYHLPAADIRRIMGSVSFSEYFSFGVTRNPFDRMVSLYHDFHNQRGFIKSKTFEDFVLYEFEERWMKDIHFLPQEVFLCDDGIPIVSQLFKFEDRIEYIFDTVLAKTNLKHVKIGHARKSDRARWKEYYARKDVKEVVLRAYCSDFEILGYDI